MESVLMIGTSPTFLTFFFSPVSYSAVRTPVVSEQSMALGDLTPFTRLRTTMMSDVALVPPNVSLCIRNIPTMSAFSRLLSHLCKRPVPSIEPAVVMNTPTPPSRSLRTFLAIQKSWIEVLNSFEMSPSPLVSATFKPGTNGTLVMTRSYVPVSIFTFSKPSISTTASG